MCDKVILVSIISAVTLPKTNSSPLKIILPKRKVVFQPSISRGYVSFREGSLAMHFLAVVSVSFYQLLRLRLLCVIWLNIASPALAACDSATNPLRQISASRIFERCLLRNTGALFKKCLIRPISHTFGGITYDFLKSDPKKRCWHEKKS